MAFLATFLCCLLAAWPRHPGLGVPLAPAGSTPAVGQFWHVTDLHLDPTYHITDDHTKVCASSKGANASNPGPFGDVMCDSPYQLILSAFDFIKNSGQEASFMIWTGDSPPHVPVPELSTGTVIKVITNMTMTIQNLFPSLQVFPALGNHDYWPQDQLPIATSKVYSAVADLWKPWLDEEAISTLRKGGFYSQKVANNPDLRIISLNTNLYYGPNVMTLNKTDPANQFEWLENTLNSSLQNKEKVYIIAHVPVGYLPYATDTPAVRQYYNEKLVDIFRKYSSVIAGQFYGHTHRDSLMVLSDRQGSPINSAFVAPAVTPVKGVLQKETNNPGVRLFQYKPDDYALLDMLQYYLNLTEANLKGESNWTLEYILTQTYGIADLQPRSLHGLAKQFATIDSKQFLKYYHYFFVSYDSSVTCDQKCKTLQICAIMNLDSISYDDCLKQHFMKHSHEGGSEAFTLTSPWTRWNGAGDNVQSSVCYRAHLSSFLLSSQIAAKGRQSTAATSRGRFYSPDNSLITH
ncbi:acid sphingomyelinase-like phosphodiesterase 3a [Cricetulus griseus]|uniref:Cyclic GMP-AMP phosphodiesterase SMPDL3A n=3 Tax=Cricetulus griseus TaxID=10029 RepID=A0A9J7JEW1_CRIGR|nr:acid sphingomyelinase-like phosphodiesterase 3a [Cricetulus griseus]XP_027293645.2 acid sphingomyelinase-like phosphodiesterase 3a [Cricetulus griseus]